MIFFKSFINNGKRSNLLRVTHKYLSTNLKESSLSSFFVIPNKKYIKVSGADVRTFLQGLITNDINLLQNTSSCIWTAFLSTKGRIIADTMIYSKPSLTTTTISSEDTESNELLIECSSDAVATIQRQLKMYKLKSKVNIKEVPGLNAILIPSPSSTTTMCESLGISIDDIVACGKDPRSDSFGTRLVMNEEIFEAIQSDSHNKNNNKKNNNNNNINYNKLEEINERISLSYDQYRYAHGVADGSEIIGRTPIECNLDFLNAVSFKKGCYIGQELVSRAKHTGVIRKRILPFVINSSSGDDNSNQLISLSISEINDILLNASTNSNSSTNTEDDHDDSIKKEVPVIVSDNGNEKEVGEVVAFSGGVGLAMMRLERLKGLKGDSASSGKEEETIPHLQFQVQGSIVKVMKPEWFET